jgi:hypothetical protein
VVTLRRINNRLLYVNGKLATECCCECNCCCDTELPAYYQPILRLKISEVQIDSDVPREAVDCIISPEDGWAIPFKEFSGNACVYQNTFRRGEGAATAGVFTITVTIPKSQASCMVIDVRFISCLDCTGSAFLGPPVFVLSAPEMACDKVYPEELDKTNASGACACSADNGSTIVISETQEWSDTANNCWLASPTGKLEISKVESVPESAALDEAAKSALRSVTYFASTVACTWETSDKDFKQNLLAPLPDLACPRTAVAPDEEYAQGLSYDGYIWEREEGLILINGCGINNEEVKTLLGRWTPNTKDFPELPETIFDTYVYSSFTPEYPKSCLYTLQIETPPLPCPPGPAVDCFCFPDGVGDIKGACGKNTILEFNTKYLAAFRDKAGGTATAVFTSFDSSCDFMEGVSKSAEGNTSIRIGDPSTDIECDLCKVCSCVDFYFHYYEIMGPELSVPFPANARYVFEFGGGRKSADAVDVFEPMRVAYTLMPIRSIETSEAWTRLSSRSKSTIEGLISAGRSDDGLWVADWHLPRPFSADLSVTSICAPGSDPSSIVTWLREHYFYIDSEEEPVPADQLCRNAVWLPTSAFWVSAEEKAGYEAIGLKLQEAWDPTKYIAPAGKFHVQMREVSDEGGVPDPCCECLAPVSPGTGMLCQACVACSEDKSNYALWGVNSNRITASPRYNESSPAGCKFKGFFERTSTCIQDGWPVAFSYGQGCTPACCLPPVASKYEKTTVNVSGEIDQRFRGSGAGKTYEVEVHDKSLGFAYAFDLASAEYLSDTYGIDMEDITIDPVRIYPTEPYNYEPLANKINVGTQSGLYPRSVTVTQTKTGFEGKVISGPPTGCQTHVTTHSDVTFIDASTESVTINIWTDKLDAELCTWPLEFSGIRDESPSSVTGTPATSGKLCTEFMFFAPDITISADAFASFKASYGANAEGLQAACGGVARDANLPEAFVRLVIRLSDGFEFNLCFTAVFTSHATYLNDSAYEYGTFPTAAGAAETGPNKCPIPFGPTTDPVEETGNCYWQTHTQKIRMYFSRFFGDRPAGSGSLATPASLGRRCLDLANSEVYTVTRVEVCLPAESGDGLIRIYQEEETDEEEGYTEPPSLDYLHVYAQIKTSAACEEICDPAVYEPPDDDGITGLEELLDE